MKKSPKVAQGTSGTVSLIVVIPLQHNEERNENTNAGQSGKGTSEENNGSEEDNNNQETANSMLISVGGLSLPISLEDNLSTSFRPRSIGNSMGDSNREAYKRGKFT